MTRGTEEAAEVRTEGEAGLKRFEEKQLPLTLRRTSTLTLEKSLLNNIKSLLYIGFYITSYSYRIIRLDKSTRLDHGSNPKSTCCWRG